MGTSQSSIAIQGPELKNPAYKIWRNILVLLSLTKCAHLQIFPKILAEFKDIPKPSMDFRGIPVPPQFVLGSQGIPRAGGRREGRINIVWEKELPSSVPFPVLSLCHPCLMPQSDEGCATTTGFEKLYVPVSFKLLTSLWSYWGPPEWFYLIRRW